MDKDLASVPLESLLYACSALIPQCKVFVLKPRINRLNR